MEQKGVLITGGSGTIGSRLRELLSREGFQSLILGRGQSDPEKNYYHWNPSKGELNRGALDRSPAIVHLAGANVGASRWSSSRKREIMNSRVKSTELLYRAIEDNDRKPSVFVSASAVGFYGNRGDELLMESSPKGDGFLSDVVKAWEDEVHKIESLGIRTVILRIGIVLSRHGGALEKMALPVKLLLGSPLGSGNQYISWIHLDDLCRTIMRVISDPSMEGVYNATAPHSVTNREMVREIGKVLHRPVFFPPLPSFVLRTVLGEMADLLLQSQRVSSRRLQNSGFNFTYPALPGALNQIYKKPEK